MNLGEGVWFFNSENSLFLFHSWFLLNLLFSISGLELTEEMSLHTKFHGSPSWGDLEEQGHILWSNPLWSVPKCHRAVGYVVFDFISLLTLLQMLLLTLEVVNSFISRPGHTETSTDNSPKHSHENPLWSLQNPFDLFTSALNKHNWQPGRGMM